MGIWWKPDRLADWNDPARAELSRPPEEAVEASVDVEGHRDERGHLERSLTTRWREEVPREKFVAALRALADALSQEQNFTFAVDHRFMIMRPLGTPSIEYYERENQRKEVTFRFSWEA